MNVVWISFDVLVGSYWIDKLLKVAVLLSVLLWEVTARPTLALALMVTLVLASCVQVTPSAE